MQAKTVVRCLDTTAPFLYLAKTLSPEEFAMFVKWITLAGQRISEGEIRTLEEMNKEFVEHVYNEYKQDIDIDFL